MSNQVRLNHQIRAPQLRVIDEDGTQMGVLSKQEAIELALSRELDLVEISPNADPPVAKIVDWGKYNYQRTKALQKQKRNAKNPEMKQMRFGLKIGDHDLDVKLKKVTSFLDEGHKVKITIFYRGREMAHKDIGFKLADRVIEMYGESAVVDQAPQLNGKQLIFVLRSGGTKKPPVPSEKKIEEGDTNAKTKDA